MLDHSVGSRYRSALLLSAVAAALAAPIATQAQSGASASAEDSPFRAGQMGVEFGLGGSFASVGLLRFSAPRRAWLFDVQAQVGRRSDETFGEGGGDRIEINNNGYGVSGRVGARRYRPVTSSVERFSTLGVSVQTSGSESEASEFYVSETSSVGAGVFAELGAAWMVKPNLSLGAVWGASLKYSRITEERETGSRSTSSTLLFSMGTVGVRGNIYF